MTEDSRMFVIDTAIVFYHGKRRKTMLKKKEQRPDTQKALIGQLLRESGGPQACSTRTFF